jgi:signal transduction histidine kinase
VIRFKSILSRIISLHVIAIGIASICIPLALDWLLDSAADDLHHRALRDTADTIARYLLPRPDGSWALDLPPSLQALYSESYGRYVFAVLDGSGHVLFSSLDDHSAVFPSENLSSIDSFYGSVNRAMEIRRGMAVLSGGTVQEEIGGRSVWIQVAEDLEHRDVLIDDVVIRFSKRVVWVILPILLLLLGIDIVIFRRALRTVRRASEMAEKISPAHADLRLPVKNVPTEILPLVQAVNQALDRLERGFQAQRDFTADAAHELRTPLTILRTRIDMLADSEVVKALRADVSTMIRIVTQLLEMAELESYSVEPDEKADLQSVCAEAVSFLAPLALAQGKSVALTGAEYPVWIRGSPEPLFRAVRNVIENAIDHTPIDTEIEIKVESNGTVRVLDRGPGVSESDRPMIFRRFWRRDRRKTGSAGLGLSIVSRIVEAHGGTVRVENHPGGGAEFLLSFVLLK